MGEKKEHNLIQSYYQRKHFISTGYRQSSAMLDPAPWYYETIVWEWDQETRKRGKMIFMEDSGRYIENALKNHFNIIDRIRLNCLEETEDE